MYRTYTNYKFAFVCLYTETNTEDVIYYLLQLNSCVLFKCNNQSQMTLYFTSQREQVKFHVGVTPGAEEVPSRDDMVSVIAVSDTYDV